MRAFVLILLLSSPAWGNITRLSDGWPSVGVPARSAVVVPSGVELVARPLDDRQGKVVVRVLDKESVADGTRYKLSYYGLEPGTFDLRDYLQRADGQSLADIPPLPVTIRSVLPAGQIEPNALAADPSPFRSRYRWLMFGGAVLWFAGLVALAFAGRRRRVQVEATPAPPQTLADRLRPLVERAMTGHSEPGEHAELERILIAYWRRQLGLGHLNLGAAMALIRTDPTAGALLGQLEAWLHRPPGETALVDLTSLLGPYRSLPTDPVEPLEVAR